MKEKLSNFLKSVAKLPQPQQPVLAAAGSPPPPIEQTFTPVTAEVTGSGGAAVAERATSDGLANYPPIETWDDWVEYDSKAWPKKVSRHYMLVPTVCFNCESACGLLAYIDKETLQVQKFEGNPKHPGSRGRTGRLG